MNAGLERGGIEKAQKAATVPLTETADMTGRRRALARMPVPMPQ